VFRGIDGFLVILVPKLWLNLRKIN